MSPFLPPLPFFLPFLSSLPLSLPPYLPSFPFLPSVKPLPSLYFHFYFWFLVCQSVTELRWTGDLLLLYNFLVVFFHALFSSSVFVWHVLFLVFFSYSLVFFYCFSFVRFPFLLSFLPSLPLSHSLLCYFFHLSPPYFFLYMYIFTFYLCLLITFGFDTSRVDC